MKDFQIREIHPLRNKLHAAFRIFEITPNDKNYYSKKIGVVTNSEHYKSIPPKKSNNFEKKQPKHHKHGIDAHQNHLFNSKNDAESLRIGAGFHKSDSGFHKSDAGFARIGAGFHSYDIETHSYDAETHSYSIETHSYSVVSQSSDVETQSYSVVTHRYSVVTQSSDAVSARNNAGIDSFNTANLPNN